MNQNIKENLRNHQQWQHLAWIIFFTLCYTLVKFVLFVSIIFQIIHTIAFATPQKRVRVFGLQLAQYIYQLVCFITYNSHKKPFPFDEWPEVRTEEPAHHDHNDTKKYDTLVVEIEAVDEKPQHEK